MIEPFKIIAAITTTTKDVKSKRWSLDATTLDRMAAEEQMMDDNFNFIASTCYTKAAIDDTDSSDCKIT